MRVGSIVHDASSLQKSFLNSLADSLLSQPDLRKVTDYKRIELLRLANLVVDQDPEFILKVSDTLFPL